MYISQGKLLGGGRATLLHKVLRDLNSAALCLAIPKYGVLSHNLKYSSSIETGKDTGIQAACHYQTQ